MMDYAWRSNRIPSVPPFPKRDDYNIIEHRIKKLSSTRQMAIINAIPEEHRPIFLWLKYHYRRPSEACALKWEDYDQINQIFIIRRGISARRTVESTKTGVEHIVPVHPGFADTLRRLTPQIGDHVFKNELARRESKRYTNESLNNIWRTACKSTGESIDLYSGLKHSSCSQAINEHGLTIYDVQALTEHKRLDSVRKYAEMDMTRKRELMERTTTKLPKLKIIGGKDVE